MKNINLQKQLDIRSKETIKNCHNPRPIDEKYLDLWIKKQATFSYLEKSKPCVLFLDGKNITKNHKQHKLVNDDSFTKDLHNACVQVVSEYELNADIFSIIDETSVIFKNVNEIINIFNERGCTEKLTQLFVQMISNTLNKRREKMILIRGTMFNIEPNQIDTYMDYRKEMGYDCGVMYFAKENFKKNEYHNKGTEELIRLFEAFDKLEEFNSKEFLYKGIYKKLEFATTIDEFGDNYKCLMF